MYSFNGRVPVPLPFRATIDGVRYTSLHEKTDEELEALGFVGVPNPVVAPNQVKRWDFENRSWIVRDKTPNELLLEIPYKSYLDARRAVVKWIDGLTTQIESTYPRAVQQQWDKEVAAALAYNAGSHTPEQLEMLTRDAAAKERTVAEQVDRILVNYQKLDRIGDQIRALFLATDKRLLEATSPLEYPGIFEWAISQAVPLAQAEGLEVSST